MSDQLHDSTPKIITIANQSGSSTHPSVLIPDSSFLFQGEFARDGFDLVITNAAGEQFIVHDYFAFQPPPNLLLANGAGLSPEMVSSLLHVPFGNIEFAGPAENGNGPVIGKVAFVLGDVTVKRATGEFKLSRGDELYADDEIETSDRGRLSARMNDGTRFRLGKSAKATLDKFDESPKAEDDDSSNFEATVLFGGFTYKSGKIGGLYGGTSRKHSLIKTPTAQIGIRGSELEGYVDPLTGQTYVRHTSGILDIADINGADPEVLDASGETAIIVIGQTDYFVVAPAPAAAQLLQAVPELTEEEVELIEAADEAAEAEEVEILNEEPTTTPDTVETEDEPQEAEEATAVVVEEETVADESGDEGEEEEEEAAEEDETDTTTDNVTTTETRTTETTTDTTTDTTTVVRGTTTQTSTGTYQPESTDYSDILEIEDDDTTTGVTTRFQNTASTTTSTTSLTTTSIETIEPTETETRTVEPEPELPPDNPPVARNDTVTLSTSDSVDLTELMLANDFDPDFGQQPVITAISGNVDGVLSLVEGRVTFTPDADVLMPLGLDETQAETFSYEVSSGGLTAEGEVTLVLSGVNDSPVATDRSFTVSGEDEELEIDLFEGTSDPDADDELSILVVAQNVSESSRLLTSGVALSEDTLTIDTTQFGDLLQGTTATIVYDYVVQDRFEASATARIIITVEGDNLAPIAGADDDATDEDSQLELDLLDNDSDGNDDELSIVQLDTDGLTGAALIEEGGEKVIYLPPQDLPQDGTRIETFTYRVSDGFASDTATVTITVTGINDAPVINTEAPPVEVPADAGVTEIPLTSIFADADLGSQLTVLELDTQNTLGNVVIGSVLYDPGDVFDYLAEGETATDSFGITVEDEFQATGVGTYTLVINGANDLTLSEADSNSQVEDVTDAVTGNLLDNDSDIDTSNVLSILSINGQVATGSVIEGAFGSLSWASNGDYAYSLNNTSSAVQGLAIGQIVSDSFSVIVTDGFEPVSSTLTITVTGTNDAPLLTADSREIPESSTSPVTGNLLDNDSDVDNLDVLTVVSVDGLEAGLEVQGQFGFLLWQPDGSYTYIVDSQSSALRGLADGQVGVDSFSYTVTDGETSRSSSLSISVIGSNTGPVAMSDEVTVNFGETSIIDVLVNDEDADGDSLTVTTSALSTLAGQLSVNTDGTLSYIPNPLFDDYEAGDAYTDEFVYTISDGNITDTATVQVMLVPDPAVVIAVEDEAFTDELTIIDIDVLGNDAGGAGALTIQQEDAHSSVLGVTLSITPDGTLRYDPNQARTFDFVDDGDTLTDTFEYVVVDEHGVTDTGFVTVRVAGSTAGPDYAIVGPATIGNLYGPDAVITNPLIKVEGNTLFFEGANNIIEGSLTVGQSQGYLWLGFDTELTIEDGLRNDYVVFFDNGSLLTVNGPGFVNWGSTFGSGVIDVRDGGLFNRGTIHPGANGVGTMVLLDNTDVGTSSIEFSPFSGLYIELGDLGNAEADLLEIVGDADLDGTLILETDYAAGFRPGFFGDSYTIVSATGTLLNGFHTVSGLNVGEAAVYEVTETSSSISITLREVDGSVNTIASGEFITGGSADEVFDLTIPGSGDTIYGGEGNDVFVVSELDFSRIDGESGTDVLSFTQSVVDLTGLGRFQVDSIEVVSLVDEQASTLTLDIDTIKSFAGNGELFVNGESGDHVIVNAAGYFENWQQIANDIYDGVPRYVVRTDDGDGISRPLLVDANLTVQVNVTGAETDTLMLGSTNADVLTGTSGVDVLFGRSGADELYAGAGDDEFRHGPEYVVADGGGGIDTLSPAFDQPIDLTVNNPYVSVELIDLWDNGSNTLTLESTDVASMGTENLLFADGTTQVLVEGQIDDYVILNGVNLRSLSAETAPGWTEDSQFSDYLTTSFDTDDDGRPDTTIHVEKTLFGPGVNHAPIALFEEISVINTEQINIDLLADAYDPDPDDVISVLSVAGESIQGVPLILDEDGTVLYDASGFNFLGIDDEVFDFFTYTIVDSLGLTSTNTATIRVTADQDALYAVNDIVTGLLGDFIVIDDALDNDVNFVAVNDVGEFSSLGATITYDDGQGAFVYDPNPYNFTVSSTDTTVTDQFVYSLIDADGNTDVALVEVVLSPSDFPTLGGHTGTDSQALFITGNYREVNDDSGLPSDRFDNYGEILVSGRDNEFTGLLVNNSVATLTVTPSSDLLTLGLVNFGKIDVEFSELTVLGRDLLNFGEISGNGVVSISELRLGGVGPLLSPILENQGDLNPGDYHETGQLIFLGDVRLGPFSWLSMDVGGINGADSDVVNASGNLKLGGLLDLNLLADLDIAAGSQVTLIGVDENLGGEFHTVQGEVVNQEIVLDVVYETDAVILEALVVDRVEQGEINTSDALSEVILGSTGSDVFDLSVFADGDRVYGLEGNDSFQISNFSFARISGGYGYDELILGNTNLTDINSSYQVDGIELFNIQNNAAESTIYTIETLALFQEGGDLNLKGDAGDSHLVVTTNWAVDGGSFVDVNGDDFNGYLLIGPNGNSFTVNVSSNVSTEVLGDFDTLFFGSEATDTFVDLFDIPNSLVTNGGDDIVFLGGGNDEVIHHEGGITPGNIDGGTGYDQVVASGLHSVIDLSTGNPYVNFEAISLLGYQSHTLYLDMDDVAQMGTENTFVFDNTIQLVIEGIEDDYVILNGQNLRDGDPVDLVRGVDNELPGYTSYSDGLGNKVFVGLGLLGPGINHAPLADHDFFITDNQGSFLTPDAFANDVDPDPGDVISLLSADEFSASGVPIGHFQNGEFTYDPSGFFNYLDYGESATDSFTYVVQDLSGATSSTTVSLLITADTSLPYAFDDHTTTDEQSIFVTQSVFDNDINAIAVVDWSGGYGRATLTYNGNGTFIFDPNGEFDRLENGESETAWFGYTVVDEFDNRDYAYLTVTVEGDSGRPIISTLTGELLLGPNYQSSSDQFLVEGNIVFSGIGNNLESQLVNYGSVTLEPAASLTVERGVDGWGDFYLLDGAELTVTARDFYLGGTLEGEGTIDLTLATLDGSGQLLAQPVLIADGWVRPGDNFGQLEVLGDVEFTQWNRLVLDWEDNDGVRTDHFDVSGSLILDGALHLDAGGSLAVVGESHTVITAADGISGSFSEVTGQVVSPDTVLDVVYDGTSVAVTTVSVDVYAGTQTDTITATQTGQLVLGSGEDDVFDVLTNGAGSAYYGDDGDDVFLTVNFDFGRISGGEGVDTLVAPGFSSAPEFIGGGLFGDILNAEPPNLVPRDHYQIDEVERLDVSNNTMDIVAIDADIVRLFQTENQLLLETDPGDIVLVQATWWHPESSPGVSLADDSGNAYHLISIENDDSETTRLFVSSDSMVAVGNFRETTDSQILIVGTDSTDTFTTSTSSQSISLLTKGGADTAVLTTGDDFVYADDEDLLIDGGAGNDTIGVAHNHQLIDLAANNPYENFENIDLYDWGVNTLTLNFSDVSNMGSINAFVDDGTTQLKIEGSQDDYVILDGQNLRDGDPAGLTRGDDNELQGYATYTDALDGKLFVDLNLLTPAINHQPQAVRDFGVGFETLQNTVFTTASVLSNDIEPDPGDVLSVAFVDSTSAQGASIFDNGDGTFNYDPSGLGSFTGSDHFYYGISDQDGLTSSTTVTITVSPDLSIPIANSDLVTGLEGDLILTHDVLANDQGALTLVNWWSTSQLGAEISYAGNGQFFYNPYPLDWPVFTDSVVTDHFFYEAQDDEGVVQSARVSVELTTTDYPDSVNYAGTGTDVFSMTGTSTELHDLVVNQGMATVSGIDNVIEGMFANQGFSTSSQAVLTLDPFSQLSIQNGIYNEGFLLLGDSSQLDLLGRGFRNLGVVSGNGTVALNDADVSGYSLHPVFENFGLIDPGAEGTINELTIVGDVELFDTFFFGLSGILISVESGTSADLLTIDGSIDLDGYLLVELQTDLFTPISGETYEVITATGGITGDFDAALVTSAGSDDNFVADFSHNGSALTITILEKTETGPGPFISTSGQDVFDGDSGSNIFDLSDEGTDDLAYGNSGNDTFTIDSTNFAAIDGGTGTDTVVLKGGVGLADLALARVNAVEVFSIRDGFADTVVLNYDNLGELAGRQFGVTLLADDGEQFLINADSYGGLRETDVTQLYRGEITHGFWLDGSNDDQVDVRISNNSLVELTTQNDTFILGSHNADIINASDDREIIEGRGGDDQINAGGGDDTIVHHRDFETLVDGNTGIDTLLPSTGGNIDLTVTNPYINIEIVDLLDNYANTLSLSVFDLSQMGSVDTFFEDGNTQIMVVGDNLDSVVVDGTDIATGMPTDWLREVDVDLGSDTFAQYMNPIVNTTLLVSIDMINGTKLNVAPVAIDDFGPGFISYNQESIWTADVLDNDSDGNPGDFVSLLSFDLVSSHGVPVFQESGGVFVYDLTSELNWLEPGETTVDSFTYTIEDAMGETDIATVSITVFGDQAPVTVPDQFAVSEDGSGLLLSDFVLNDYDNDPEDTISLIGVDNQSFYGASIVEEASGDFVYDTSGAFDFLAAGETAEDVLLYRVEDEAGRMTSGAISITVTGENDGPVVNQGIDDFEFNEAEAVFLTLPENAFFDADDEVLTITNVAGLPPSVIADIGDGTLNANTLSAADVGIHAVTVTVEDSGGLTATTTFDLAISSRLNIDTLGSSGSFTTGADKYLALGDVFMSGTANEGDEVRFSTPGMLTLDNSGHELVVGNLAALAIPDGGIDTITSVLTLENPDFSGWLADLDDTFVNQGRLEIMSSNTDIPAFFVNDDGFYGADVIIDGQLTILAGGENHGEIYLGESGTLAIEGDFYNDGTLSGNGSIVFPVGSGNALISNGEISPELVGSLYIGGADAQLLLANFNYLEIKLEGNTPDEYGHLDMGIPLSLGGELDIDLDGTYRPTLGDSFVVVTTSFGLVGDFAVYNDLLVEDTNVILHLDQTSSTVSLIAIEPTATGTGTFTATVSPDVFLGSADDNFFAMTRDANADIAYGGDGEDLFLISDLTFSRLDGGDGVDTLAINHTGTGAGFDFRQANGYHFDNIEVIDDSTGGPGTLSFDFESLLSFFVNTDADVVTIQTASGGSVLIEADGFDTDGNSSIEDGWDNTRYQAVTVNDGQGNDIQVHVSLNSLTTIVGSNSTLLLGTDQDDTLVGGPGTDVAIGYGGRDTILLGGGDDIAYFDSGIDSADTLVDGGTGVNTLTVSTHQNMNLWGDDDHVNFQIIDLDGQGVNHVYLNAESIVQLNGSTLSILGSQDDSVIFEEINLHEGLPAGADLGSAQMVGGRNMTSIDIDGVTLLVSTELLAPLVEHDPVARDDYFEISEDGSFDLSTLLDNDLSLIPDGDIERVDLDQESSRGVPITPLADGLFIYDPGHLFDTLEDGEEVTDSFVYTIADGEYTDTATVNVLIRGDSEVPEFELADTSTTVGPDFTLTDNVTFFNGTELTVQGANNRVEGPFYNIGPGLTNVSITSTETLELSNLEGPAELTIGGPLINAGVIELQSDTHLSLLEGGEGNFDVDYISLSAWSELNISGADFYSSDLYLAENSTIYLDGINLLLDADVFGTDGANGRFVSADGGRIILLDNGDLNPETNNPLVIEGHVEGAPDGKFDIDLDVQLLAWSHEYDQIVITGNLDIAGSILDLDGGVEVLPGDVYTVITANSITGEFLVYQDLYLEGHIYQVHQTDSQIQLEVVEPTHEITSETSTFFATTEIDIVVGSTDSDVFDLTINAADGQYYGGSYTDTFIINDFSFARIDGGTEADTIEIAVSAGDLDFTTLSGYQVDSIEIIDALNENPNVLTFDLYSGISLVGEDNWLEIRTDTSDTVIINVAEPEFTLSEIFSHILEDDHVHLEMGLTGDDIKDDTDINFDIVGRSTIILNSEDPIIIGSDGVDILYGTTRDDEIISRVGADEVYGLDGDDDIYFDSEDTILSGGPGIDELEIAYDDQDIDLDESENVFSIEHIDLVGDGVNVLSLSLSTLFSVGSFNAFEDNDTYQIKVTGDLEDFVFIDGIDFHNDTPGVQRHEDVWMDGEYFAKFSTGLITVFLSTALAESHSGDNPFVVEFTDTVNLTVAPDTVWGGTYTDTITAIGQADSGDVFFLGGGFDTVILDGNGHSILLSGVESLVLPAGAPDYITVIDSAINLTTLVSDWDQDTGDVLVSDAVGSTLGGSIEARLQNESELRINGDTQLNAPTPTQHSSNDELVIEGGQTLTLAAGNNLLNTGVISGSGTIDTSATDADVFNLGTISPGESAGILTFAGGLDLNQPGSELLIEIGGTVAVSTHDQLSHQSAGTLTLGGRLNVGLINAFVPTTGSTFVLVSSFAALAGEFATAAGLDVDSSVVLEVATVGNEVIATAVTVTQTGSAASEPITLSAGIDVVVAGAGDDLISLISSGDTVYGQDGNDRLETDGNFNRIDGGGGVDSLHVTAGFADLQSISSLAVERIEILSVDDLDSDIVELDAGAIVAIVDGMNNLTGVANSLVVIGNSGDILSLHGAFVADGTATLDTGGGPEQFNIFREGDVFVYLDGDIALEVVLPSGDIQFFGTTSGETLFGSPFDDFLDGGAGADTLFGESGNDQLIYDATDLQIDGGTGIDKVSLLGGENIDLGGVNNLTGIEHIEMAGGGNLSLDMADVFNGVSGLVDELDAFIDDIQYADHQLLVSGELDDSLTVEGVVINQNSTNLVADLFAQGVTVGSPVLIEGENYVPLTKSDLTATIFVDADLYPS